MGCIQTTDWKGKYDKSQIEIKKLHDEAANYQPVAPIQKINNDSDKLFFMSDEELANIIETDYRGLTMFVRIINVYDGDTFTCVFWDPHMEIFNSKRCRLNGVDAPEMKPLRNKPNRIHEKKMAIEAKEALINWANTPYLLCKTSDEKEKYGRLLVDIYKVTEDDIHNKDLSSLMIDENSLTQYMLDETESVIYYGGTKS